MSCQVKIDGLNVLSTCPDTGELLLFFNVTQTGNKNKMALRTWATVKNCLLAEFFGIGTKIINGTQLDGDNIYLNSDLINNLVVFYNGLNRFLLYSTEWEYVLNVDNNVIGVQILLDVTFTSEDVFLIFPNPQPV